MTVQLTVPPTIRPYRGFEEPALPNGYWIVHQSVLGDATGGLMSVNIRFSSADQPNVSTIWNLETLAISAAEAGSATMRVDFGNMDPQPLGASTGARTILYALPTLDFGVTISGRALELLARNTPIFLGSAGKGVNGDLAFDTSNIDTLSLSVRAQGYFWGPEAVNAPGGPQRPATGLFGA